MSLRRLPPWLVVAAFTGTVSLGARPALADPPAQAQAAALFTQGRALRKDGNCAAALPLFRRAYQIYPDGLGSLRNTAECEEELSHPTSAYEAWMDLKRALVTRTEQKYAGWEQDADGAVARLAPLVTPSTADLHAAAGQAPSNTSSRPPMRSVAPPVGRSTADNRPEVEVQPEVAPAPAATSSGPGVSNPARPTLRSGDHSAARTVGWVGVAIGAASAVGFTVSLILRQSALQEVHEDCGGGTTCDSKYQAALDPVVARGHTDGVLVGVFGGMALAGAAAGVILLTVAPSHSITAALRVSPSGVAATGSF